MFLMIILRNYQDILKQAIYTAWSSNFKNVLAVCPTGSGKCMAKNTPVLMYDGSIKMSQNIIKGDILMGYDSLPRNVLSTTKGIDNMFKVKPIKGDSHVFNKSHILTLRASFSEGKHKQGDLIDISINDYIKQSENFKRKFKWTRVGVEFPLKPFTFDPYLLGLYLAEGLYCGNQITTPEPEIIDYIKKWSVENNIRLNIREGRHCKEIWFADYIQGWNKNRIKLLRKTCTDKYNRWIPKEYLTNSREVRLQLLAGLLDGDGYYGNGYFEILTKYNSLKKDILYICRSLGLAAYSTDKWVKLEDWNEPRKYHRISISGEISIIPNKVERKKATPRKQIKSVLNTGFSLESVGEDFYYGFELDGDGRYLLGDFSITHNTKTFCSIIIDIIRQHGSSYPIAVMVHRKELVQQICLTLAEEEIEHNIIAARKDIKGIIGAERRMFKKQLYNANSSVSVISVDTLNSRYEVYKNWALQIKLVITDEAAHVLEKNKWGRAISYFKNAIGLGVTACPERLDRKGLGSHVDGLYDTMVEGPPTRWMIDNGYLSKYKIAVPESDYNYYLKSNSESSDYTRTAMIEASNKSQIVGDVVDNYLKFAKGKQAILFASDVNTARKMEQEFKSKGVKAKSLDGTTPAGERLDALIKFREKEIQLLINVDLFDEGLDVPGIECVIMARPTKSLSKFLQMIGRGLRIAIGKEFLIVIDHVGNVMTHGLPCKVRRWTLDRIKKSSNKLNFLRICSNIECNVPYDRVLTECPWCGEPAVKASKGGDGGRVPPSMVDGDLFLVDPETLRELEELSELEHPGHLGDRIGSAINANAGIHAAKKQQERIAVQKELAEEIALTAGKLKRYYGYTDRMIHKKFYLCLGQTITEVLGEPKKDMLETIELVRSIE